MDELQLWGGIECTVNRTSMGYRDQIELSGHHNRLDDLDLIASLGVRKLRYPLLWERIEAQGAAGWRWCDERMDHLRRLNVGVIAGLIHHGSGPEHTHLLDDGFAPGLAAHAAAVAQRYPWIDDWTPVNEPLTTARFAALYGIWHPHARDEGSFWRALVNQIDAVRLSMKAIRAVNPAARLIQTDDLGRTYATAPLREQAAFDNQRRWAGWDMLCGRMTPLHPLFKRLARFGLGDRLRAIAGDPCPPDVIGLNHYLTSDRFLDHRAHRYPAERCGGNGRMRYADVEAIRVLDPPPAGFAGAIEEAWARYRIPLAITELHNGCTREEQLRWVSDGWDAARQARAKGVDLRAVTIWALLGSRDWNTLLTGSGIYEPGAFDTRGTRPRPTALAALASRLAQGDAAGEMAGGQPGWWRRPLRLIFDPVPRPAPMRAHAAVVRHGLHEARPLLITGATGTLGQAFGRACAARGIPFLLTGRDQLDLTRPGTIERLLDKARPWAVVNAAGWVRLDDAECDETGCMAANAAGTIALGAACATRGLPMVAFSSDLVFDGTADRPYREDDAPSPLNAYGRSKAAMEAGLVDMPHLVVRTSAFFSPHDPHNFAHALVAALRHGERFAAARDEIVSPTYVPHLVDACLDLLIDGEVGLWHLANAGAVSWADFATLLAEALGLDAGLIDAVPGVSFGRSALRPHGVALESIHGAILPPLENAIAQFAALIGRSEPHFA